MSVRLWLWLAAAQVAWAGSYVAMKFAGAEMPVGAVVTLRYGLAAALYAPLVFQRGLPRIGRSDWGLIAVLGALNFTVSPSLQVLSLRYTQAIDVSILVALEPLVTVFAAAVFLRERLGRRTLAAGGMALAGALALSGVGVPGGVLTPDRLFGNGLYLAATVCELSVTLAGVRLARRYDPLVAMGLLKTAGFLTALVVYAGVWDGFEPQAVGARAWWSIAYLAAGASVFAYGVWYRVLREAPVTEAALSLFLQPAAGVALGYFVAGEAVGWNTLAGGALILGALLWQRPASGAPPAPSADEPRQRVD